MNVTESDLTLVGVNTPQYAFSGFSYNPATFTATWTLATPLKADKLLLDLNGHNASGVTDQAGDLLEWRVDRRHQHLSVGQWHSRRRL